MTLILGARCHDGVVLVADTKFTINDGSNHIHDREKITGEINGVLSAFSGSRRIFESFRVEFRDFVSSYSGPIKDGIPMDKILKQVSDIMNDLSRKFGNFRDSFDVLLGISGTHFPDEKSKLRYFFRDGGHEPVKQYRAIGIGFPHATYYLKRYYHEEMNMNDFAQLADFIIRYTSHDRYTVEVDVGLDPTFPYPQIIYIPDDPNFCKPYNNGNPKLDCSPTEDELKHFKSYSDDKLSALHNQPF
jgi:20S proteasome alpha/beta subunit